MIAVGEVISFTEMCAEEGVNLQRGMNYRLRANETVVLMSIRPGAPYADRVEEGGRFLIYEGHDSPRKVGFADPKGTDQPLRNPGGSLTQNGLFWEAVRKYKERDSAPEVVKVYEKVKPGIWVYNGRFRLVDAWRETDGKREVFKFKLKIIDEAGPQPESRRIDLDHNRLIPSSIKREVWKRDKGRCVLCGGRNNLHFDHDIPYSKGGSSLTAANIRILCARHNLAKRDRIE